jgi:hypothetical protein
MKTLENMQQLKTYRSSVKTSKPPISNKCVVVVDAGVRVGDGGGIDGVNGTSTSVITVGVAVAFGGTATDNDAEDGNAAADVLILLPLFFNFFFSCAQITVNIIGARWPAGRNRSGRDSR